MDQEADDYDVLAALHDAHLRYVIRAVSRSARRRRTDGARRLARQHPSGVFRTVRVTPRSARTDPSAPEGPPPARDERRRGCTFAGNRSRWAGASTASRTPTLSRWAVHVFEPDPPHGDVPIGDAPHVRERHTLDEATAVVDHYRARWLVEEYFKALKTGCAFETRQLTTFDGLVRALAIFIPLAWRLLTLRHLGRTVLVAACRARLDAEQRICCDRAPAQRRYHLPAATQRSETSCLASAHSAAISRTTVFPDGRSLAAASRDCSMLKSVGVLPDRDVINLEPTTQLS